MKYFTTILFFSHFSCALVAQSLRVGDSVPEIYFNHVLNDTDKKAKLSDFAGKLVLLDMWSSWCSSCIAAFPKMHQLQAEFGDQLQVLLVNPHKANDNMDRITNALQQFKKRTGFYPSLPIPLYDTVLNDYFPHESVPHVVWIDQHRKVVAITLANEVTASNIRAVINGEKVNFTFKDDWLFDASKPLVVQDSAANNEIVYRSVITGYKPGFGFRQGQRGDPDGRATGYFIINTSLRSLIRFAYVSELNTIAENRLLFDVQDGKKYRSDVAFEERHCYDLTVPAMATEKFDVQQFLREDLKRSFGVQVAVEKRKIKTWVITAGDLKKIASRHKDQDLDLEKNSLRKFMHNYPVEKVVEILNGRFDWPLVNETGITYAIDIDFPRNFNVDDQQAYIDFLQSLGFRFTAEEREMEVGVIRDGR